MGNVLIASSNTTQTKEFCNHLAKDKNLNIFKTYTGLSTLDTYSRIKPNVLVLDYNFNDMNCIDILNNLSKSIVEKRKCNTILTLDTDNIKFSANTIAKVYDVLYTPFDFNYFYDIISEICTSTNYKNITEFDINALFIDLKIPINSTGAIYLKEAIFQCYYYPNLLNKLDDVISFLAQNHHKSKEAIRSNIRTALLNINNMKEYIKNPIMKYFDYTITPKAFLEIVVTYLQMKYKKDT